MCLYFEAGPTGCSWQLRTASFCGGSHGDRARSPGQLLGFTHKQRFRTPTIKQTELPSRRRGTAKTAAVAGPQDQSVIFHGTFSCFSPFKTKFWELVCPFSPALMPRMWKTEGESSPLVTSIVSPACFSPRKPSIDRPVATLLLSLLPRFLFSPCVISVWNIEMRHWRIKANL